MKKQQFCYVCKAQKAGYVIVSKKTGSKKSICSRCLPKAPTRKERAQELADLTELSYELR